MTLSEAQIWYEDRMKREALEFAASLANMRPELKLLHADKIKKQDETARKALKLETEKPAMAINIRLLAGGAVPILRNASEVTAEKARSLVDEAGSEPATDEPGATSDE